MKERDSVNSNPANSLSDLIDKAVIQMVVNVDKKNKKYKKRKIYFQIEIKGKRLNYVSNLTTDLGNFRKFDSTLVSKEDSNKTILEVMDFRKSIIENNIIQTGHKVYMGKFRKKGVYKKGIKNKTKVIPSTWVIIFFNKSLQAWEFIIKFNSWGYEGELNESPTLKQKESDIVKQHFYYKRKYIDENEISALDELRNLGVDI